MSSANATAAWSATSIAARSRACCPACRPRSSISDSKVERAAFLYVADILGGDSAKLFEDSETDDSGDESPEGAASRIARSRKQLANRKIEDLIKPGQNVLCQVTKDPIGLKGARVTGYLSLPGRYSVFMPHVAQIGVSKRIGSDKERRRLRDIVNEARPKGTGFIVRTAAEDANDQEMRDDVDFLARLWGEIERREEGMNGPGWSTPTSIPRCAACAT